MSATDADCHRAGPGQRALGPRHPGSHDDCELCTERHCRDCGVQHVRKACPPDDDGETTCPRCVGNTRTDIAWIRVYVEQLPDEAEHHPNAEIPGGTATYLLGPVSLDYPAAQARRILDTIDHAEDHGCDGHGHPEACVWPRTSCCRLTDFAFAQIVADDPLDSDPPMPLFVLASWEDAVRDLLDAGPGAYPATVEGSAIWLSSVLHRVAQHDAWPQMAADIRALRASLEGVLAAGTWPAVGVPCISVGCTCDLRQTYTDPDPCTHDTPARRHARVLVAWNRAVRGLGYPEALVPTGAIRAALRVARQPCAQTGCDQGGRRSRWRCPACRREYDQLDYDRAKAHHATRLRLTRERVA